MAMGIGSRRATLVLWVALLVIVVLFAASLVAASRAGAGVFSRANAPNIPPKYLLFDTEDLMIEGCYAPLPSGEQEVRLKLYNTALSALRNVSLKVELDGKPPKAPAMPITIRRFPRSAQPEIVLLFEKTHARQIEVEASYQWGLLGSGGGRGSFSMPLAPCQSAPSQ